MSLQTIEPAVVGICEERLALTDDDAAETGGALTKHYATCPPGDRIATDSRNATHSLCG